MCFQPDRGARTAACGVDHQVGTEYLLGAAVGSSQYPCAGDPASVGCAGQSDGVAAFDEDDTGQCSDSCANAALEECATDAHRDQPGVGLTQPMAAEVHPDIAEYVPDGGSPGGQLSGEAGEQLLQHLLPPS